MEVIGPIIIPVVMVTVNDGSIVHRRRVPSKNSVIKIAVVSYYDYVLSCMLYIVLSKTRCVRFAVFVAFGPHRVYPSRNASVSFPTMHHSEQKCTHFCSVNGPMYCGISDGFMRQTHMCVTSQYCNNGIYNVTMGHLPTSKQIG